MADGDCAGAAEEIKITVKSPKDKKEISISRNANVKQLKDIITKEFSADLEQLCLIYAGKILKDTDRLAAYGIKDGTTVHLVIKSANKAQDGTGPAAQLGSTIPQQQINVAATPFGLGSLGGLLGLSNLGFGSANFMDLQHRMQSEVFTNPDLLRNLVENPFVQQMMSNPALLQSLISANPQMRELIEANPEISRVLQNPELLQQASQVARNPAMMQELMRNTDGQSMFDTLSRNRQAQEPMLGAAAYSQTSDSGTTAGRGNDQEDGESASSNTNASSNATATFGLTNAGIESITQQMMQNPQLMTNIMQAPYMQSMLQNLASNPDTINEYMNNTPLIPGDSAVQESVRAAMPSLAQQLVNPEIQSYIGNPRALQAMMDIQQGMQQLQNEAPGLLGEARPSSADQPTPTTTSSTSPVSSSNQMTTTPAGDEYARMLGQMFGMMSGATNPSTQSPESRYEIQLNQLAAMGFVNRQANILALSATSGDLNAAVDRLLRQ